MVRSEKYEDHMKGHYSNCKGQSLRVHCGIHNKDSLLTDRMEENQDEEHHDQIKRRS